MQNDHKSLLSPEEESIINILANHAPETKSDPETGKLLAAALDAFWFRVTGTGGRLTASRDLQPDVAIRLECAAYDAIEAWRAENPPQMQNACTCLRCTAARATGK